ncbi:MAG: HIT domain-containing protein [Gemmataceae bacterium]
MDQLWAPWRLAYVAGPKPAPAADECFLCQGLAATDDRTHLIAARTPLSVIVLNRYPYNNGHLLIAPRAHKSALRELTSMEILDSQQAITRCVEVLSQTMRPDGFNIGLNLGKAAGAGLPGHLHWHVVPRWNGDTNFMPVLSDVRVIVQSLEALYQLITPHLAEQDDG